MNTYLLLGSPNLIPRFPSLCSGSILALGSSTANLAHYLLPLVFRRIIIVIIFFVVAFIDMFVVGVSRFLDRCRVEIVVGMGSWRKGISTMFGITQYT
jgi:hypothetical protein